ncbi:MAG: dethiobiotin synthase [Gammaproteobacteria bacterium]
MSGSGVFITGTDTSVGKTVVSAGWIRWSVQHGLRVAAMKPVATGGVWKASQQLRSMDAEQLWGEINVEETWEEINPYVFAPPVSPNIAADQAGIVINIDRIVERVRALEQRADTVVVEGVGGWRVPLGTDVSTVDLVRALGYPVVLVVGLRLGCINHALLTMEAVTADRIPCLGWVANRLDPALEEPEAVLATLVERLAIPCLGIVPLLVTPEIGSVAQTLHPPVSVRPPHGPG